MSTARDTTRAIRMTLVLWVISAVIYPIVAIAIGFILPFPANGSILQHFEQSPRLSSVGRVRWHF